MVAILLMCCSAVSLCTTRLDVARQKRVENTADASAAAERTVLAITAYSLPSQPNPSGVISTAKSSAMSIAHTPL